MLEKITCPEDVKRLSPAETEALAFEIRQRLIDAVAHRGGHLASNLGAVELTLALHRVFSTPQDKLIFDVGHQSYTHKLLTGRQSLLENLRAEGGVSGFPKRGESPHDAFGTGHASTAISAALGLCRARDLRGERHAVIALVGDGALTGGLCYEAMSDAGSRPTPIIVLLNDNEMSIAANVGAVSRYLTRLRGSRRWVGAKRVVKRGLSRVPLIGAPIARGIDTIKRVARLLLLSSEFFEALGFAYLGPIDGHDIPTLERALRDARAMGKPVVVHAVTQKGRGYALAERKPEAFHGVAPFFVESGRTRGGGGGEVACKDVVGDALVRLAESDDRVAAITAAMEQGTGLVAFARRFPARFFDVGIAEGHAITMAAGLAAGGLLPYFAVYASFLPRAIDGLLHDACLQNLPVRVLLDHAGFVPGDGATHQGVYDLPMLRTCPNLLLWTPSDAAELRMMIEHSADLERYPCPLAIRYPKALPESLDGEAMTWRQLKAGKEIAIATNGATVALALEAAKLLPDCAVWAAPDANMPDLGARHIFILEESFTQAGIGVLGGAPQAHSREGLLKACALDAESVARRIREALDGR